MSSKWQISISFSMFYNDKNIIKWCFNYIFYFIHCHIIASCNQSKVEKDSLKYRAYAVGKGLYKPKLTFYRFQPFLSDRESVESCYGKMTQNALNVYSYPIPSVIDLMTISISRSLMVSIVMDDSRLIRHTWICVTPVPKVPFFVAFYIVSLLGLPQTISPYI